MSLSIKSAAGLVVALGVVAGVAYLSGADERMCRSGEDALIESRLMVESQLRAPASAQFPDIDDLGVKVTYLGECRHEVESYVDAQNAFGAMLRREYRAEMQFDTDVGVWIVNSYVSQ